MLTTFSFNGSGPRVVDDPDEISRLVAGGDAVVWTDLLEPTDEDLAWVAKEFDVHPLAIEDASKHGQRPKLELYAGHAFLVVYAKTPRQQELDEIDIFVGPNWLITVHEQSTEGAHFDIAAVRERCDRSIASTTSVGFLLYTVLDEIVDTYFAGVEDIGDHIDAIEERIFSDADPEADELPLQREMLLARKDLLAFRRRVVPLREVLLMILREEIPWVDKSSFHYFQDILDHVMRITDEIDNRRELLGNAVDAHLAMVSNQMDFTMKRMTSWGAILIVSSIITGIFGMNFAEMDFVNSPSGFRLVILSMIAITVGLYLVFKRKRWL